MDGEIDSELGARYGVVTINAKTLPPLRLPEARLSWPTTEQNYNVTQRNHVDIGTLIRQWLPLVYPVNQQLALRGKKIVVFFTDGYSGEYLIVNPLSAVCCTYVPGSLRDPNGNKVDEQLRPISRTPAASSGTTSTTIDGGRRELTIQGVAFEYNVPGSRISRRGVVHVVDLDYRTLQRYRRMP